MKAIMKPIPFLVPFTLLATTLFGQNQKLSREFDNAIPSGNVNVIVQYDHNPSDADRQRVIARGGIHHVTVSSVKGDSFSVPASSIADLANDLTITHISIDHKLGARNDYAAAAINATVAWNTYSATGKGVGIAIIDSGISGQNDVSSKIVYTQDFTGGNGTDAYGHGTHVADTAAGNRSWMGTCSTCTRNLDGMAPDANLINLRVLDANGEASDSTVISAIETAIQLKSKYNIRVINLSLGRPPFESYTADPLCQAVEAAWKAGIVVVVAAGNDGRVNAANNSGYGTVNAPGNDPYVLTVGAMKTLQTYSRTDDLIASYSSKGPSLIDNIAKPDLVAPGNYVVSALTSPTATLPTSYPGTAVLQGYYDSAASATAVSAHYYSLSGTSMAAAVTTGAVADLLQVQPNLTPDQVKARLMLTAYKTFPTSSVAHDPVTGQSYTSYYDAMTRGAGYLDVAAALANTTAASGPALSPTVQFSTSAGKPYLQFASSTVWALAGTSGSYAAANVWGGAAVNAGGFVLTQAAALNTLSNSASSAVWGNSSVSGTSVVWGNSLLSSLAANSSVWGASSVWGNSTVSGTAATVSEAVIGEK